MQDWPHIQTLIHGPGAPGWEREGQGDFNSAVFACLMTIATAYTEPPLTVYRARGNREYNVPDHQLQKLLDKPTPNGELSMEDIWFWIAWAKHTDGNAYLLKVRAGDAERGNVVQLWPVSPADISPITERDQDGRALAWISHYRMRVGPSKYEQVPVDNILHFRLGVDPQDRRLGISPLKRLLREVATDDQATQFTDTLLKNFAIPGLVVVPRGATIINADDAERLENRMNDKFTGDNRGKVAILSKETELYQFGFSPEQLQMETIHRIPEERIAAVMGVPAIVAGLGAGLEHATYSNFREAREMFTESKLVPEWRHDASRVNVSLLPDFTSVQGVYTAFDITNVRALQEDQNERYARLKAAVEGGILLRNEAREDIGYDPIPGWDDEDKDTAPKPIPPQLLATNEEPDEEDDEEPKMLRYDRYHFLAREQKASRRQLVDARRRARSRSVATATFEIERFFNSLAEAVIAAAARQEPAVASGGNGHAPETKALTRAQWATLVERIFDQQAPVLEGIIRRSYIDIIGSTWESLNVELGQGAQFSENDPLVRRILRQAGEKIQGIQETTLDALRPVLQDLYQEGQPIAEIADAVRGLVQETYQGRAEAIARTEVGAAQNQTTSARYASAGVKHVEIFDNGFSNSHEFCRRVDGKVVSLDWFERNPLQHPNCVRAGAAVFDYDGPVFTEEVPWG